MPLNFLLFLFLCCYNQSFFSISIMLDPIGNAAYTGREIGDCFERNLTWQCAQEIKKIISQNNSSVSITITRTPGETVQYLQNASFANRLAVDFYLAIGFYHEPKLPTHATIFYYLEHPTDTLHQYQQLKFYPAAQAHFINIHINQTIAKLFAQTLQQNSHQAYLIREPIAAPISCLLGVTAPALYLEIGLEEHKKVEQIAQHVALTIESIVQNLPGTR